VFCVFDCIGVLRFCLLFLAVNGEEFSCVIGSREVLLRSLLQQWRQRQVVLCICWWDIVDAGAFASVIIRPCSTVWSFARYSFHFHFCSSPVHFPTYWTDMVHCPSKILGLVWHIFRAKILNFTPAAFLLLFLKINYEVLCRPLPSGRNWFNVKMIRWFSKVHILVNLSSWKFPSVGSVKLPQCGPVLESISSFVRIKDSPLHA